MRAVIYARVSTENQTTDNQIPALESLAAMRELEVTKIYSEEVSAWKAGRQQKLKALLKDASYHKFDVILVWALDRLTREGIGSIMHLVNTFKTYGVKVISYQEPWTQQDGAMADLLYAITAWVAEFESKRRSERIKAAIERKKARGEPVGRQPGAKDKKKRSKLGYYARYADRRD